MKVQNAILKDILTTIAIMGGATVLAFLFFNFGPTNAVNIALVYILALILTAKYTKGYWYGIFSALFCVICVNYFFTYPHFKLDFTLSGYPLTFIGMLTIALITSATMTHMKIQTQLLLEREEMLRNADKEKMRANLLRAISHDLRTPLTSIIGASNTYLENGDTLTEAEKESFVTHINGDANWLLNIVENLLSVTRIQEGKAKVNKTLEAVEEVVSEAVLRFKKRQAGAEVHIGVPEEVIFIPMDALLIEQVLINLLENAYIHGTNLIATELSVKLEDDAVAFHVRDYGRGIAPEQKDTIFDGIGKMQDDSSDAHRGMGIGLSICKTIVEAHNGRICVKEHKEGTEFVFLLPKEEEDEL